jgi:hypothetical protein
MGDFVSHRGFMLTGTWTSPKVSVSFDERLGRFQVDATADMSFSFPYGM